MKKTSILMLVRKADLEKTDIQGILNPHAAELTDVGLEQLTALKRTWRRRFWCCCGEALADYQCSEERPPTGGRFDW